MQINPGGRLNTRDVVGRDNEIARYWRVLERQGLVISAERRIGKTHIVLKMRDECRSGFLPFYMLSLTVPPMAQEDTCGLAAALLEETRADAAQIPELASRIAGEVGGFPYYIHHVVDQLDQLRRPAAPSPARSHAGPIVVRSESRSSSTRRPWVRIPTTIPTSRSVASSTLRRCTPPTRRRPTAAPGREVSVAPCGLR